MKKNKLSITNYYALFAVIFGCVFFLWGEIDLFPFIVITVLTSLLELSFVHKIIIIDDKAITIVRPIWIVNRRKVVLWTEVESIFLMGYRVEIMEIKCKNSKIGDYILLPYIGSSGIKRLSELCNIYGITTEGLKNV